MDSDVFVSLRRRIQEAINAGALAPDRQELIQGTLMQLLGECERKRQAHEAAAARLMEQYHRELGQRDGITMLSSMIQDLIQAQILRAQRDAIEQKEYAAELQAKEVAAVTVTKAPRQKRGRQDSKI